MRESISSIVYKRDTLAGAHNFIDRTVRFVPSDNDLYKFAEWKGLKAFESAINISPVEDLAQKAIIAGDEDVAAARGVGPDAIDWLTQFDCRQRGESLEVVTANRVVPSARVQVSLWLLAIRQCVEHAVLTLLFVTSETDRYIQ